MNIYLIWIFIFLNIFKTFVKHENYQQNNFFANDIALLKLERIAVLNKEVSPICLSTKTPNVNAIGIVTGWV